MTNIQLKYGGQQEMTVSGGSNYCLYPCYFLSEHSIYQSKFICRRKSTVALPLFKTVKPEPVQNQDSHQPTHHTHHQSRYCAGCQWVRGTEGGRLGARTHISTVQDSSTTMKPTLKIFMIMIIIKTVGTKVMMMTTNKQQDTFIHQCLKVSSTTNRMLVSIIIPPPPPTTTSQDQ